MSKLDEAIAAIKAGDKAMGKRLLAEILKVDRRNEDAWLWLVKTDITHEEKIKSLQNALHINPNNEIAKRALAQLQAGNEQLESGKELLKKPVGPVRIPTPEPLAPPTDQGTKQCPYCAETIKAGALVCRFCGRDLDSSAAHLGAGGSQRMLDNQAIEAFIAEKTYQGWQIVGRTESGVQLRRPKRWSNTLLILGFVGLIFLGAGLIFLLLAALDYLVFQQEKLIYVTVDQIMTGDVPRDSGQTLQIAIGFAFILACGICWYAARANSSPTAIYSTPQSPTAAPGILDDGLPVETVDSVGRLSSSGGCAIVEGEVRNTSSDKTVSSVRVTVTYYDAADKFLATDWSYIQYDRLSPGEVSPFSVSKCFDQADEFESYRVGYEGRVTSR